MKNYYTYRDLKEALLELSEEDLSQPVIITDDLDDEIYLIQCTDCMNYSNDTGFEEQFKDRIPKGQNVLCLSSESIQSKEDIEKLYKKGQ